MNFFENNKYKNYFIISVLSIIATLFLYIKFNQVDNLPNSNIKNNPQSKSLTEYENYNVIKKSSSGICHAPGTTYYSRTKNFIPFDTLQACLDSGGRLPLR